LKPRGSSDGAKDRKEPDTHLFGGFERLSHAAAAVVHLAICVQRARSVAKSSLPMPQLMTKALQKAHLRQPNNPMRMVWLRQLKPRQQQQLNRNKLLLSPLLSLLKAKTTQPIVLRMKNLRVAAAVVAQLRLKR
jgi:hypothetical protein